MPGRYPIQFWGEIFESFAQVSLVRIDSSAERLDITIKDRKEILQASDEELNDTLYKHKGNPKEVASYFLRKHGIITYYQNTLIGFFDIVGYSSFINPNNTPFEECISKTGDFFNSISNTADTDFAAVKLDHWILSDSIILVIDTIRHPVFSGSLEVFLATCSEIMKYGMTDGFPLRGAIGGGDFYKDGEVMVSTALANAASYEKKQEWLGAVLTPEAFQVIERAKKFEIKLKGKTNIDLASERFNHYVRYGEIPWKTTKKPTPPKEAYYIKPFEMSDEDWAENNLPEHFDSQIKIKHSHILYAKE